jgi:hypothetical protein
LPCEGQEGIRYSVFSNEGDLMIVNSNMNSSIEEEDIMKKVSSS